MKTKSRTNRKPARRDRAHRGQPSLLDPLPPKLKAKADEGKRSRDETYEDVLPHATKDRNMWLGRIIAAGPSGVTLFELSQQYGIAQNVFSGRVTELKDAGKVVFTKHRRPTLTSTAAVIVATEFLASSQAINQQLSEQSQRESHRGPRRSRDPDDTMPDALTNPKSQRDANGDLLQHDSEYAIYDHGKLVAGRVRVYEDDLGTLYMVRMGSPNAHPQRVDEMTKGMRWEKLL